VRLERPDAPYQGLRRAPRACPVRQAVRNCAAALLLAGVCTTCTGVFCAARTLRGLQLLLWSYGSQASEVATLFVNVALCSRAFPWGCAVCTQTPC
jgi:hypothetical protein